MHRKLGWLIPVALVLVGMNAHAEEEEDDDAIPISFEAKSCFNADYSTSPYITFFGPDDINLSPFGESHLEWEIGVLATDTGFDFVDGWFNWTLPDDDDDNTLYGKYTDLSLDPRTGDYTLDWAYLGGTGEFEDVSGFGQTEGNTDLSTLCAVYSFSGMLYEDD